MTPSALVLAAGRGSRLRPLTDHQPKPLIEVAGRALIRYHLEGLAAAGVARAVVNLGWLGEQIRDQLRDTPVPGLELHFSEEGWPALETGGGIARALPLLGDGPFLVCNADVYSDYPHQALLEKARQWPDNTLAHLVLVPNPDHNADGDFALGSDGQVQDHGERLTFSGLSVLHPRLLDGHEGGAFPLAPWLRRAIARGRVSGECHQGLWSDVGTSERLAAVRAQASG